MYKRQIGARAADGVLSHGSIEAYTGDFRACSKAFEMFVADRLSRRCAATTSAFFLWEDLDAETKEARGLTKADAGVDVTDGATTLVQCKLRSRYLTWRECSTFFASAISFADGAYSVPWQKLLLARNACSTLSRTLAELGASRPFDLPIPLSEFRAYLAECLAAHNAHNEASEQDPGRIESLESPHELRDFQREAVSLCTKETERAAYVVLPTGCGKSLIMAHVAANSDHRVLILVPLVVLGEQMIEVLASIGFCSADPTDSTDSTDPTDQTGSTVQASRRVAAVGGAYGYDARGVDAARVVVCVYNSAYKLDFSKFKRILIDEAHFVRAPMIYADLVDDSELGPESPSTERPDGSGESSDTSGDSTGLARDGYAAVRAATTLASARLFSATLDVPEGAERCTRTLREMIGAGYLCDYQLHVPVFDVGATSADLARFLVRNYRSMLVFCSTRAEGLAFCSAMNATGPCAKYIDCETPRAERRKILGAFKRGSIAFVVNVRVLSVGFDAPITKGVCFVNMPASKTHIIQVIGRCLRLHHDKLRAHVVLPLVTGAQDESKRARDFMRVLAQNDARFARALSSRGGGYVSVHRVESADADNNEAGVLYTAVYDSMGTALTDAWYTWYTKLVAYYAAHGRLPPFSRSGGLGAWVAKQRSTRATMGAERRAMLEALPFWTWNVLDEAWLARRSELVAFHDANGRLPPHTTPVGRWANAQRAKRDTMAPERRALLDALPWWTWSVPLRGR